MTILITGVDLSSVVQRTARCEQETRDNQGLAQPSHGASLTRALDAIGDWWTQRILREAFLGIHKFEEFQFRLTIPRQTLSQRLKGLVNNGIFDVSRGGYRLTPCGMGLYPWALMVWSWTRKWAGDAGPSHPSKLVHHDCGQPMLPVFSCGECQLEVGPNDVKYESTPFTKPKLFLPLSPAKRWAIKKTDINPTQAGHHIAFMTADRWMHLILSSVLRGCCSFDSIQQVIGISSNILSQRLTLLVKSGFLSKNRSKNDARSFNYRLTPRSRDVFRLTIALEQWADSWLFTNGQANKKFHSACGSDLKIKVLCSNCSGELHPRSVSFHPKASPSALAS
jgi:DNA-binding HxlR family transcriptional regulator